MYKVLLVASVYAHLAAFHLPLMKLLQERGVIVHAAASSAAGFQEVVAAAGVACWEIPFARSPYSLANIRAFSLLKAVLKENRYDLIHIHTPVAAFMGRYLAKATAQGPVLYTAHGFHFYRGAPLKNWLIYYTAERVASRWTDGLIVINKEDFEHARHLGFRPDVNLFHVPGVGVELDNGCSPLDPSLRSQLGLEDNDVLVACVAELNTNKNHSFLLDAWKGLSPKCDHSHLLLIGDGVTKTELQGKVEAEQIPRVHFLGYRQDIRRILPETDLLTLVSKREGLPRVIMEAMAEGKPVVATNIRGSRDLVEDGETGLLVELGDVAGLIKALETLILHPESRSAMGANGQKKAKGYMLEEVLAKTYTIYEAFLQQRQSDRRKT